MTTKKVNKDFDPEFGADFRVLNQESLKSEMISFMEMRLANLKKLPAEDVLKAKLLQLKYRLEDFLTQQVADNKNYFSSFLEFYVDTLYDNRSQFAQDIDISSSSLSHLINAHREPTPEFLLKLVKHSNIVYSKIVDFDTDNWVNAYYHEKACDLLAQKDEKKLRVSVSAMH